MDRKVEDLRRYRNLGYRRAQAHFFRKSPHAWSLYELYPGPTRWAELFKHRRAGQRISESFNRLRNQMIDCISLSRTPFIDGSFPAAPDERKEG